MKKITIVFLVFVFTNCKAQNLVNNWSFEDTVACPAALFIDKAVGWTSFNGSPDYFNDCNNMNFGMPNNMFGYQFAKSGVAYGGFLAKSLAAIDAREIIGAQLNQPLVIGQLYYVSFYVNRSYNLTPFNNYNNMAVN